MTAHIRERRSRRRILVGAGVTAAVLTLVSCSDDPPDPDPAAEAMAAALASGDLSGAPLVGADAADAQAQVEEITEGMGDTPRSVQVRALVPEGEDDDAWSVTFDVSWDIGAGNGEAADASTADDATPDEDESGGDESTDTEETPGESPDSDDADSDRASADGAWAYTTTGLLTLSEGEEQQWQVEWSPALIHPDLQPGDRLRTRSSDSERGDILGADGEVLVTERDVYRIGIDKTRFEDGTGEDAMADAARELADLIDVDGENLADQVLAAGERAFVEAITFREEDAQPLLDGIAEIDGAVALSDTMSLAPTREFARPILGTVGDATAEIVEESEGRIEAGDIVGLSGLQQQYDDALRGTPGITVELVPAEGDPTPLYESEPVPGANLVTTLDLDVQSLAESVLADVEPASAIVAVQPSSGNILAAASGPGGGGYSTATLGQYAPGSTFKVATSLALLRSGMSPDTTVECPNTITVDGREFGNYSDYPDSALGDIPLETAVAESCNTAFISSRDDASQGAIADAAASLGLVAGQDLGFASFLGDVPAEADGTSHAAAMIGQGEVLASPLGMATVAASVAAGETVTPRLLDEVPGGSGGGDEGDGDGGDGASSLESGEAAQLQEMMRAAVDGGSASFLADVPGDPVAAKTGTAEYGTETPPRTHAWMIAAQGDLAVAVFVEDGESGSQTAGPLLEEFLTGR
ncbi:penicillin-binding transpeptidase domain-containing protein [Phytoactinopolyspora halotolerans]|uniref:Beta-lactamase n=1 Tax=Phytoactinopolyspora halotolerans TaxID=1981512 RepID=A0A6L9SB36_9ACTN|nr:penicillin-binding transpeptidase domain-containing protein [Phytoactinopolyspora halotolerans]NEE01824.1 penicillin-binding protein [Phytoactinopolyspora halotolerans]